MLKPQSSAFLTVDWIALHKVCSLYEVFLYTSIWLKIYTKSLGELRGFIFWCLLSTRIALVRRDNWLLHWFANVLSQCSWQWRFRVSVPAMERCFLDMIPSCKLGKTSIILFPICIWDDVAVEWRTRGGVLLSTRTVKANC